MRGARLTVQASGNPKTVFEEGWGTKTWEEAEGGARQGPTSTGSSRIAKRRWRCARRRTTWTSGSAPAPRLSTPTTSASSRGEN
eukprot:1027375-Alexandrium_andersonii.AAC.1